ncbi:glycosyltransferase [Synechococcus sp. CCY 9618]|uniref:glycosyltransferase family 2 protein n=1 Tax=Synechococcus sp. CCY 9618 TaxID=2815602 RepID=UPI001C2400A0|nr:glycosyltransferase [Synechococcus sp. CCY 9618]
MSKKISVVIATYCRYEVVPRAIDSLLAQQGVNRDDVEIIVVDNTPKEKRQRIANDSLCDKFIHEDISGLSRARNLGIAIASAPLVAFLDDDAIAHPTWVLEAQSLMEAHPGWLVLGGRIIADYREAERPNWMDSKLEEFLSCVDWPVEKATPMSEGTWIAGANMVFRKKVFESGVGFDTRLGRNGTSSLLSNDETELFEQIGKENIYYTPSMPVQHVIPANRLRPEWFRKRVYWQALSDLIAGTVWMTPSQAQDRFQQDIAQVPAEYRSYHAMAFKPRNSEEMNRQLRLIYSMVISLSGGLPDFEWTRSEAFHE